jgi:rRNA processing protein Gar1
MTKMLTDEWINPSLRKYVKDRHFYPLASYLITFLISCQFSTFYISEDKKERKKRERERERERKKKEVA